MANKLRPFRDYSEHDVINLFAHVSDTVDNGTIVKINSSEASYSSIGWRNDDNNENLDHLGDVGQSYTNVTSERYGVLARCENAGTADTHLLGMTLYEVAETDENGEKLIYNPRKAAEMQAVVSGQAVPIVSKGLFLFDYGSTSGAINGLNARVGSNGTVVTGGAGQIIGRWLGNSDKNGHALLQLDVGLISGKDVA